MIDAGTVVHIVMRGQADGSCLLSALIKRDDHLNWRETESFKASSFNAAFGKLATWCIQQKLLDVPPPPKPLPLPDDEEDAA